jgi:molybdenum cofactor cytidylyltransferase
MFGIVILAAGRSTRMGGANKLLADLFGAPLIARTAANALASSARPVLLVTGHMAGEVESAAGANGLMVVHNSDFATGMASSLRVGLAALPADVEGAVILLGDMPLIASAAIDALTANAAAHPDSCAVVPAVDGAWAHPVVLRRRLFVEVSQLSGDAGARRLLMERTDVRIVEAGDPRLLLDADDPEGLAAIRRIVAAAAQRA